MQRIISVLFLLFLIPTSLKSQIIPKENSQLNYRLIGFSFPAPAPAGNFTLEIAAGNYNSDDSFKRNIVSTFHSQSNKIIAEVPSFGTQYTWRVNSAVKASKTTIGSLHHFSTGTTSFVDTTVYRLRIIKSAKKYNDAFVFSDGTRTLYDMNGSPVWYLPNIVPSMTDYSEIRGLKLTSAGTITFLLDDHNPQVYEINYKGDILWKGPNDGTVSGDSLEFYHHDFMRLKNGHYMALGNERALVKLPSLNDSTMRFITYDKISKEKKTTTYESTILGTIIEYDEHGNVVWLWKSSKYFGGKNIDKYITSAPNGSKRVSVDVHENSFYFDEKMMNIYVSFKNINRIIKVKYPEGKVIKVYGEKNKAGNVNGNQLFCDQHSCKYSENGYLYLFNNNVCSPRSLPTIIKMKEPSSVKGNLVKIWEYECSIEGVINDEKQDHYEFLSGGNVIELPDQSMFALMSGNYTKMFIVSNDKEILWSATPEQWNPAGKKWLMLHQYAANIIIDHKDVENLIWNQN